jgi:hypothetical protein
MVVCSCVIAGNATVVAMAEAIESESSLYFPPISAVVRIELPIEVHLVIPSRRNPILDIYDAEVRRS